MRTLSLFLAFYLPHRLGGSEGEVDLNWLIMVASSSRSKLGASAHTSLPNTQHCGCRRGSSGVLLAEIISTSQVGPAFFFFDVAHPLVPESRSPEAEDVRLHRGADITTAFTVIKS